MNVLSRSILQQPFPLFQCGYCVNRKFVFTAQFSNSSSHPTIAPRVFPDAGFRIIPQSIKMEEETLGWYTRDSFYPVHIGEVLNSRYQVLYKLGFGSTSTVWMCRDLVRNRFACVKSIHREGCDSFRNQVEAYEHLAAAASVFPRDPDIVLGEPPVAKVLWEHGLVPKLDEFQLHHVGFDYNFLVQHPLGVRMSDLISWVNGLPIDAVQQFSRAFLKTLNFVHSAKVVHTDIQPKNIIYSIGDFAVLETFEAMEISDPSSRKIKTDHSPTIFETRSIQHISTPLYLWINDNSTPVLCSFGQAQSDFGKDILCTDELTSLSSYSYCAPEMFFNFPWNSRMDIWSFGCMLWEAVTAEQLFPRNPGEDSISANGIHLARMSALLGPPPRRLIAQTAHDTDTPKFFTEDGSPIWDTDREQTLESRLISVLEQGNSLIGSGITEKEGEEFLAFLRRVLVWDFNERPSAAELLEDPWVISK